MTDVHAAIDIGTNSFHLVVARALPNGGFDVVTTEKDMVRLGSGGGDMKRLAPDAIERGLAALARMTDMAASLGADVSAVATSAVREAENRQDFVRRARDEVGIDVEVISGLEEARLIHHGVIHALPVADQRVLVVDIGGGSTEFIIGDGSDLVEARSLRLGAIRLTERFFAQNGENGSAAGSRPKKKAVQRCRSFLQGALDGVSRDLRVHQPETAIGSSGTITSIASMIAATKGGVPRQMNGFTFTADELSEAVAQITTSSAADRRKIKGLDERRADIIVGGSLLLDELFAAFGVSEMTISEFALREGVLFDRFPAGGNHLQDLRRSNAVRLARQLDPDADHAETTSRLATQLFDLTKALHDHGPAARELLATAAIVHNVGMFISHSGHHKHTQYIVRNSEQLTGFTEHEVELISLIGRYHRKSHPSAKHADFADLDDDDKQLVRILAGLLRIAIGLDRRHTGAVGSAAVRVEDAPSNKQSDNKGKISKRKHARRLVIEPVPAADAETNVDLHVEVSAANERTALLAEALDLDVEIEPPTS